MKFDNDRTFRSEKQRLCGRGKLEHN
jgi:hypothetical protein